MTIRNRIKNDTMFIILSGELDEHSAKYCRNYLDDLINKNEFNKVIFDFSELTFMDSTGIGVLIGRYKILKNKGVPIFICNPSSQIERIFLMTGIYDIMPKIS